MYFIGRAMIYELIEGSEVNCTLSIDSYDGQINDLTVIDEEKPYGFAWRICPEGYDDIEQCDTGYFDSREADAAMELLGSTLMSPQQAFEHLKKFLPEEELEEFKEWINDNEFLWMEENPDEL